VGKEREGKKGDGVGAILCNHLSRDHRGQRRRRRNPPPLNHAMAGASMKGKEKERKKKSTGPPYLKTCSGESWRTSKKKEGKKKREREEGEPDMLCFFATSSAMDRVGRGKKKRDCSSEEKGSALFVYGREKGGGKGGGKRGEVEERRCFICTCRAVPDTGGEKGGKEGEAGGMYYQRLFYHTRKKREMKGETNA